MSGRSSRRDVVQGALVVLACCGKSAPEADPAKVKQLAAKMTREVPTPAATRECTPADLAGGATLTFRTLTLLAGGALAPDKPEEAEWINPPELDAPAARILAAPRSERAAREAAAQLLAAPFYVVYKVDLVNAPMALGVKELKVGNVGTRVIRYEKTGKPTCVQVFIFENDHAVNDAAVAKSDQATMDPAISKLLRDDLAVQYIKLAPRGAK